MKCYFMQLSLSWCIHSCSSAGYSQLIRDKWKTGEKTGTPSFCLDSLLFTESIIRTSKWIALQHRHDSQEGGCRETQSEGKKKTCDTKRKRKAGGGGEENRGMFAWGMSGIRLWVSAALCCSVALGRQPLITLCLLHWWYRTHWLPPPTSTLTPLLQSYPHIPMWNLPICCKNQHPPTHTHTHTQYLTCVLVIS